VAEAIDYGFTASATTEQVGPKFLRITDIQNGLVNWSSVPWCSVNGRSVTSFRLKAGDIVFARTGATTGKSFLVRECPEDAVFASYLIRVRMNDSADPRFVSHFFDTPDYWRQIARSARGAAQPGVNATKLKGITIPFPPLPEQQRIADLLDRANALRTKRQAALALLQILTQSIFLDMFGNPATNPKGWPIGTLGAVATFIGGGTPSRAVPEYFTGPLCWATSKDMKDRFLDDTEEHVTDEAVRNSATKLVSPGTILVVVKSKVLMHRLPVAITRVQTCFGQDLKGIALDDSCTPSYVATTLRVNEEWLLKRARGINTEGLTLDHLRRFPLLLPPISLQNRFAQCADKVELLRQRLSTSLDCLDALFASLQHRAFAGEL